MFIRTKARKNKDGTIREYLQIVENERVNGKVRQRVIGTLGRVDQLKDGQLDSLIDGLCRVTERLAVIDKAKDLKAHWSKEYGIVVLFRRLWSEAKLDRIISELLRCRQIEFDVAEAVFAMVLNRLVDPSSKLKVNEWTKKDVYEPAFEKLQLHHFYRALDVLAEYKDKIEEALFFNELNLFNQELDLVFFDTTSAYFEAEGTSELRRYGYSRDKRPDRTQVVIGLLLRSDGVPIAHEVFPGDAADVEACLQQITSCKKRFRIRKLIFVADRGMVSSRTLKALEEAGYDYIVGMKMRKLRDIREVLSRPGRYSKVDEHLEVKNIEHNGKRYIVCVNPEEAEHDRRAREQIIRYLEEKLKNDTGSLLGNRSYRKYLTIDRDAVRISEEKVREDERYDGKYVLQTSTELPASQVAQAYKQLWRVERAFRELKSSLELRPMYHWTDQRIRGHIMVCFLAFYLETMFARRLESISEAESPKEVLEDVCRVKAVEVELGGKRFIVRTQFDGKAHLGFKAVGMRPPGEVLHA